VNVTAGACLVAAGGEGGESSRYGAGVAGRAGSPTWPPKRQGRFGSVRAQSGGLPLARACQLPDCVVGEHLRLEGRPVTVKS